MDSTFETVAIRRPLSETCNARIKQMLDLTKPLPVTSIHTPVKVYADASRDSQSMCAGGWVFLDHSDRLIDHARQDLGRMGSVQAEHEAIERALEHLERENGVNHVKLYSDCTRAIAWVNEDSYSFESLSIEWKPREENRFADLVAGYQLNR